MDPIRSPVSFAQPEMRHLLLSLEMLVSKKRTSLWDCFSIRGKSPNHSSTREITSHKRRANAKS